MTYHINTGSADRIFSQAFFAFRMEGQGVLRFLLLLLRETFYFFWFGETFEP